MTKKKSGSLLLDLGRKNYSRQKYTHKIKNKPLETVKNTTIYKHSKNNMISRQKRKRLKLQLLHKTNQKKQQSQNSYLLESYLINCSKSIKNPIKVLFQKKMSNSKDKQIILQNNKISNEESQKQQISKSNDDGTNQIVPESYQKNEKLASIKSENVFLGPIVKEQSKENQSIEKMQDKILNIISQLENQLKESAALENSNNFFTDAQKQKENEEKIEMRIHRKASEEKQQQNGDKKQRENKIIDKQKQRKIEKDKQKSNNSIYLLFQNQLNQKLKKSQQIQSIECQAQQKTIRRIYIPKLQILEKKDANSPYSDTQFTLALKKITEKKPSNKAVNCDRQRKKYPKKKYFIEIDLFNENIQIQNKKIKEQKTFKNQQKESLYKINYYLPINQSDLETRFKLVTNTKNISGLKLAKTEFMLKSKLLKCHPKEFVEYLEFSLMKIKKGKQGRQDDPIILENKIFLEETMMTMVSSNLETSLNGNKICKFEAKNYSKKLRSFSKTQHPEQQTEKFKWRQKEEIEY